MLNFRMLMTCSDVVDILGMLKDMFGSRRTCYVEGRVWMSKDMAGYRRIWLDVEGHVKEHVRMLRDIHGWMLKDMFGC